MMIVIFCVAIDTSGLIPNFAIGMSYTDSSSTWFEFKSIKTKFSNHLGHPYFDFQVMVKQTAGLANSKQVVGFIDSKSRSSSDRFGSERHF